MALSMASSTFAGVSLKVQTRPAASTKKMAVVCKADSTSTRRNLLSLGALTAAFIAAPKNAKADLVEELLAKTESNKALNDKKRAATSSANFARSRTVTDGTCAFPNNLVGCENLAERGDVKFLSDDLKLECEGTSGICPAKAKGSLPSFLGV